MQWWNDLVTWLASNDGGRVMSSAIIPFVAIIIAGLLAALIARSSARRVLAYQDREVKAAAVMALIGAGRRATVWSSLGGDEKQRVDNQLSEADIRIRLLPVSGTTAAADWAAHELAGMKKHSSNFSFQADQTFVEFRNRLLEWQERPKRARKLFAFDLEQWRFDDDAVDKSLLEKQQQWSANQAATKSKAAQTPPATTSSSPSTPTPSAAAIAAPIVIDDHAAVDTATVIDMAQVSDLATAGDTAPVVSTGTTPVPVGRNGQDDDEFFEPAESYATSVTAGAARSHTDSEEPAEDDGTH